MKKFNCLALTLTLVFVPKQSRAAQSVSPASADTVLLQRALEQDQKILQDWPNLARYRNENSSVPTPSLAQERVIFLGDSITDFWGRKLGSFFPGKTYLNRGITGQTAPQMLLRFRQDVISLKPNVVVILAGTNDLAGNTGPESLEDIEGYLLSMVQLANANDIRVVLSSVLPVSDYFKPRSTGRPPTQIKRLNAWMKNYCGPRVCVYLDYYNSMLDENRMLKKELTSDGLHPNDAGYAVMEPLAERAIQAALGIK